MVKITGYDWPMNLLYTPADYHEAFDYLTKSIDISEELGGKLGEEHKPKAFEYLERSKSKAFLDLLANSTLWPSVEMTEELKLLLQEEENHLVSLREIQIRSSKRMLQ